MDHCDTIVVYDIRRSRSAVPHRRADRCRDDKVAIAAVMFDLAAESPRECKDPSSSNASISIARMGVRSSNRMAHDKASLSKRC